MRGTAAGQGLDASAGRAPVNSSRRGFSKETLDAEGAGVWDGGEVCDSTKSVASLGTASSKRHGFKSMRVRDAQRNFWT